VRVRALLLLVWGAAIALIAAMLVGALHEDVLSAGRAWTHYAVVGPISITLAVFVWARRPESRIGPLITATVLAGAFSELPVVFPASALAVTVGYAAIHLDAPLFAHLTLSYPSGRLSSRLDRAFVTLAYAFAFLAALPFLLLYSPRATFNPDVWDCASCAVPYTHVAWYDVDGIRRGLDAILVALVVAFLVLLTRKVVRTNTGARRVVLPLLAVLFFLAVRLGVELALRLTGSSTSFWTSDAMFWAETIGLLGLPLAFGIGLLRGRTARSAVADLVVELARTPPGSVRDALARTLGDPTLELALRLPAQGSYVDGQGRPVELPPPSSDRAVTVLGASDGPVAALIHDPALLEQQALLRSAGAAARLALENERLQAELQLQLDEVRASRARIVRAGDQERRRLERDLHDGAQQRLLSLGLALQLIRSELGAQANGARRLLAEAEDELTAGLEELRELAQGIHPAVLTEHGLGPALRTLAARSPVPVELRAVPERLPEPVEAAAYFVVSEALTNVAKHARASTVSVSLACRDGSLVVEVDDDGAGGASSRPGSGLAGLADRVHALDGRLTIESNAGRGTRLRAEIPYATVAAQR
jgi:signal transduction histidine kinase